MTPPDTKSTKEGLRATLADLTTLHGAPGFEQPLVKYFQRRVAGLRIASTSTATATSPPRRTAGSRTRVDSSHAHGVPTISVGVARRYSYSPNEVVDLNDLALAVRLLARFVGDMETHRDLGFL